MPRLLWLAALMVAAHFALADQFHPEKDPALLEKARKYIADNTPKGLSPLKPADVTVNTRLRIAVVDFAADLECDEPRYLVAEIQSGGKPLPVDVMRELRSEGLNPRYLAKKRVKGDAVRVIGTFSIRADGTFGTIKAFTPEYIGVLRNEENNLPVEGDERYLATKEVADTKVAALAAVKKAKASAGRSSLLDNLTAIGGALGSSGVLGGNKAGSTNSKTLEKIGNATNLINAIVQAAAPSQPATTNQPAASPKPAAAEPPPPKPTGEPPPVAAAKANSTEAAASAPKTVNRAKFCSECGTAFVPAAKFCANCGVKIVE